MKLLFFVCLFSFTASANPVLSVKERLRLHLWAYGLEEKPVKKLPSKPLREEIERPLRKL